MTLFVSCGARLSLPSAPTEEESSALFEPPSEITVDELSKIFPGQEILVF